MPFLLWTPVTDLSDPLFNSPPVQQQLLHDGYSTPQPSKSHSTNASVLWVCVHMRLCVCLTGLMTIKQSGLADIQEESPLTHTEVHYAQGSAARIAREESNHSGNEGSSHNTSASASPNQPHRPGSPAQQPPRAPSSPAAQAAPEIQSPEGVCGSGACPLSIMPLRSKPHLQASDMQVCLHPARPRPFGGSWC